MKMDEKLELEIIEFVRTYPFSLKEIEEQTEKICLAAVNRNGNALEHVKDQTEKICLAAVKNYGCSLRYVKHQTTKVCIEAVKQDSFSLQYVKDKTEEICIEAVKRKDESIAYANNKNKSINVCKHMKDIRIALTYLDYNVKKQCLVALELIIKSNYRNKEVLSKIIKRLSKDKIAIDTYTKYDLWKYVDFFNLEELNNYAMIL